MSISCSISRPISRPISRGISEHCFGISYEAILHLTSLGLVTSPTASADFVNNSTDTDGWTIDHEGKAWPALAGEIRRVRGRQEHNHFTAPNDFADASWVDSNATHTADGTVTVTAQYGRMRSYITSKAGQQWRVTGEIRAISGNTNLSMYASGGGVSSNTAITISTEWEPFSYLPLATTVDTSVYESGFNDRNASGFATFQVRNMMIEDVAGQADQNPSDFVDDAVYNAGVTHVRYSNRANGNTVDGNNKVTWAQGLLLGTENNPELVTNGTDFPDTVGWAAINGFCSIAAVAGELEVTIDPSAAGGAALTVSGCVPGQFYALSIQVTEGTGTVTIDTHWTHASNLSVGKIETHPSTGGITTEILEATAETMYIGAKTTSAEGTSHTFGIDNVTVKHHQLAPEILIEPARTNHVWPARDLTHANWATTNITPTLDRPGMDGAVNFGTRLRATGTNGTAFLTLTLGSLERATYAYVKREVGTGTIEFTDDGGTTYTDITNSIATTRFSLAEIVTTQANPVVGFRIVSNTDEIIVDFVGCEDGATVSTPLETTTATVTRDKDRERVTDFTAWAPLTSGLWLQAFTPRGDWATMAAEYYLMNSSLRIAYRNNTHDGLVAYDGTSSTSLTSGHTPGTEIISCTYYDVDLDVFCIGYYKVLEDTWHWDTVPATFSGFSPAGSVLEVGDSVTEGYTLRALKAYDSVPPGSTSAADIQTWVEANAVAELVKR